MTVDASTRERTGAWDLDGHRNRLEDTIEPLADLPLWIGVTLALVPFLTPVFAYTVAYTATMGADPGFPEQFPNLPLGIGYLVVLGVLWWRFDDAVWAASAVFRRPSGREIGAAVAVAVVGFGLLTALNRTAQVWRPTTRGRLPRHPGC